MSDAAFDEVRELQRAFKRICFDASPAEEDLRLLGADPARWRLYREMVRLRLRELLQSAFPRTRALLGATRFTTLGNDWLTAHPPRTRYLRDIAGEFARWTSGEMRTHENVPAHTHDLLALEAARWECMHGQERVPANVVEFEFDRVPVVDPGARLLTLEYAVNDESEAEPRRGSFHVCVHRRNSDYGTEVWTLNQMAARMLAGWKSGDETAQQTIARILREDGTSADEKFIDGLGTVLSSMIERGVILGSR